MKDKYPLKKLCGFSYNRFNEETIHTIPNENFTMVSGRPQNGPEYT